MDGTSSSAHYSAPSTEELARWDARQDPAQREALVDAYAVLVRRIAAKCFRRRVGGELEYGDFVQFGMVGLLEAIDRFEPARGTRVEGYASLRVEGAILDGIASLSEMQRQIAARRERQEVRNRAIVDEV